MGAVGISGNQKRCTVAFLQHTAVQRPHIVVGLHQLTLVLPCPDLSQQQLLAPHGAVRCGIGKGAVRQDRSDDGVFVFGILLRLALRRFLRHGGQPRGDEYQKSSQQNEAAAAVFLPPLQERRAGTFFFHR